MEAKSVLVGVVIALLVVAGIGGGVYAFSQVGPLNQTDTEMQQTPTPTETAPPPEAVNESKEGAKVMKKLLNENGYDDARVFVQKSGEVVVTHNSTAESGPELKSDMERVAMLYVQVVAEHPETGGLSIHSNGVTLMVSSDTAIVHSKGDINEEAYKETFHYTSQEE